MQIVAGPWRQIDIGDAKAWAGPEGCAAAIDLRTMDQVTESGRGLFVVPDDVSVDADWVKLGSNWQEKADGKIRQMIKPKRAASANDIIGCVLEQLTENSDPEGINGLKPIVASQKSKRMTLCLGPFRHASSISKRDETAPDATSFA